MFYLIYDPRHSSLMTSLSGSDSAGASYASVGPHGALSLGLTVVGL